MAPITGLLASTAHGAIPTDESDREGDDRFENGSSNPRVSSEQALESHVLPSYS